MSSQTFHLSALGTVVLQTAGGRTLTEVTVGKAGDSTATVTLYDNTAGSGTVIGVVGAAAAVGLPFGVVLTKGLTVVVAGAAAPDVTVIIQ